MMGRRSIISGTRREEGGLGWASTKKRGRHSGQNEFQPAWSTTLFPRSCDWEVVDDGHVHAISRKHSIFPLIFDSYPSREKRNCLAFKSIGSSGIEAFWLSAAHFRLPPPAAAVIANGIENSSSSPSLPRSLPSIVRAHCDLNGCLDRSEGNKMFARLLTPRDRRTDGRD